MSGITEISENDIWLTEARLYSPPIDDPGPNVLYFIAPSNSLVGMMLAGMAALAKDKLNVQRFVVSAYQLLETANILAEDKPESITEITSAACIVVFEEMSKGSSEDYARQQMSRLFFDNRWYYRFVDRATKYMSPDFKLVELYGALLYRLFEVQVDLDIRKPVR